MVLAFLLVGHGNFALANGRPMITQEQAIEIGNKQVSKMNIDLRDLDVEIDDGNKGWIEHMTILRTSPVPSLQRQYHQYEAKLKGHSYWSIFYQPKSVGGRGFKGGGATVLVDSKTGLVLLAIRGE